jgi:hypothetical protein
MGCPFQLRHLMETSKSAPCYDGIVHAVVFPCHKDGAQRVDASNKKHVDIQPTRKWTEGY